MNPHHHEVKPVYDRSAPPAPAVPASDGIDADMFRDDEPEDHDHDPGEECGRWDNGRLTPQCRKAGSEECDWECPYSR